MIGKGPKKADVFLLAFGGKVAPDAALGVQHIWAGRLGQGRQLQDAVGGKGRFPSRIVQIQKVRGRGFIDRVQTALGTHRLVPAVVLVGDAFPA